MRPAHAEIPDHSHFIGKPYRARELLGEVNDMMRAGDQLGRASIGVLVDRFDELDLPCAWVGLSSQA
jgi:hypothetical protein